MTMPRFRQQLVVHAFVCAVCVSSLHAQTATWTGGGVDDNWTSGANWAGGTPPTAGNALGFGGTTRLTPVNNLTADTSFAGITFDAGAGPFTLSGNRITLGGNVVNNDDDLQTIDLALILSATRTFDAASGNIALGGTLSGSGGLTKAGAGTVTLGAAGSAMGALSVSAGTLAFVGGSASNTGNIAVRGDGTVSLANGASLTSSGVVFLGNASGEGGNLTQSSGTLTINGVDTANQNRAFVVGEWADAGGSSTYTLSGGSLSVPNGTFFLRWNTETAIWNMSGGAASVRQLQFGAGGTGTGTLSLTGGRLAVGAGGITQNGGAAVLNLGGGTLAASANWSSTLPMTLTGTGGSTTFDTAGNTNTLSGVLSGAGGLVKTGTGSLTISGLNTYAGGTTVNQGTLLLGAFSGGTGTIRGTLTVESGATVDYTLANAFGYTAGSSINVLNINGGTVGGANVGNHFWNSFQLTMTGGTLKLGGGNNEFQTPTFTANAASTTARIEPVTSSAILRIRDNTAARFTVADGSQAIDMLVSVPVVQSGTTSDITKLGAGRLALTGTSAANTFRNLNVSAGALTLGATGSNTTATGGILVGETITVGGGSATLDVPAGSLSAAWIRFGDTPSTAITATLNQTGGSVTTSGDAGEGAGVRLGHFPSATTFYNLSGGTLTVGGGFSLTIAVDGTGTFYQTGGQASAAKVVVNARGGGSGNGTLTVEGGTLTVGTGGIVNEGTGPAAVNLGGGTLAASGTWSSTLAMTLTGTNGNTTFDTAANTITLGGVLSGSGGLAKAGGGELVLSGANTFVGAAAVNAGRLRAASAGALPTTAAVTVASTATLELDGFSRAIASLAGAGTVENASATPATLTAGGSNASTTFAGVIQDGAGGGGLGLVKVGGGTLTLSGASTFTGSTTVNGGTLTLAFGTVTADILPAATPLALGGGALQLTGTGTQTVGGLTTTASTVSRIVLGANQTLTLGPLTAAGAGSALNVNTAAGGADASTTAVGTGVVVITGQTPGTAINPGFTVSDAGGFGLAAVNGSNQVVRATTTALLTASGAATGTDYRIDNNAGGSGAAGSSTLTVTASESARSVTVDTTAASGTLTLGSGAVLGTNAWNFGGSGTNTYQITGSAGGAGLQAVAADDPVSIMNVNAGAVTFASPILANGTNAVNIGGSGTTVFSVANSYTGATTVSGGVLDIRHANSLGATTAGTTLASGAALQVQGGITVAEPLTLDGTGIAGDGALRNVTGTNTFTGAITLGSAARIASDAGTLTLDVASGSGITATNQSVAFGGAGNITVADPIATGTGAVTKDGAGTLLLSAANTYSGVTTVSAGTLRLGNSSALGATTAGTTIQSGATLDLNGAFASTDSNEPITVSGTGVGGNGAIVNTGASITNRSFGNLTLAGNTTIGGPNRWDLRSGITFTGNNNTLTKIGSFDFAVSTALNGADIVLNSGFLTIQNANALGTGGPTDTTTVNSGATLAYFGAYTIPERIIFNGGALRSLNNSSTFSGSITLNSATNVTTDAGGHNITLSGVVDGAGGLTKLGTSRLTLSNATTYAGTTTISAGTLALGTGGSFASSPTITVGGVGSSGTVLDITAKTGTFTFPSGQTVRGIGTIRMDAGDVAQFAGTLAPGNSPGILTVDGGTALLSGTTQIEIFGATRGTGYDAIDLANAAGIDYANGVLALDFGSNLAAQQSYQLFGNGSSSLVGDLSSVTVVGTNYTGLTFTGSNGVWTSQGSSLADQTLTFTESTGTLVIVPEPGTQLAALAVLLGVAWRAVRRPGGRREPCPSR